MSTRVERVGPPLGLTVGPGAWDLSGCDVQISELRESPWNPRKTFVGLDELAASIAAVGLLQPLVVRRRKDDQAIEIVCGHRRFRALQMIGRTTAPCVFADVGDVEALALSVHENLQRSDLSEIEEAEAYEALAKSGMSIDEIATMTSRSQSTVRGRLKLTALVPRAREALEAKRLPASAAVPLARLSGPLQLKALETGLQRFGEEGGGAREWIAWLTSSFTIHLRGAPFKAKDDLLVPEAGSCDRCPKNAKNMHPGEADDLGKAPGAVCVDVDCYRQKVAAHWDAVSAKSKAAGCEVLSIAEGHKLFAEGVLPYGSRWVDVDVPNHADPKKRTWRELLAKIPEAERPKLSVAPDRQMQPHTLAPHAELVDLLAKHTEAKWARAEVEAKAEKKATREEDGKAASQRRALERATYQAAVAAGVAAGRQLGEALQAGGFKPKPWIDSLRMLAESSVTVIDLNDDVRAALGVQSVDELEAAIAAPGVRPGTLLGIVFALSIANHRTWHSAEGTDDGGWCEQVTKLSHSWGVKLSDFLTAAVQAEGGK